MAVGLIPVFLSPHDILQNSTLSPSPAVSLQGVAPCVFVRPTAMQLARFKSCDQRTPPFLESFGWCVLGAPCCVLLCIVMHS